MLCLIRCLDLQMNAVGITENVKGDHRKFEIWYSGREEVYVVQVCSFTVLGICTSSEQGEANSSLVFMVVGIAPQFPLPCLDVMGIINFKRSRL